MLAPEWSVTEANGEVLSQSVVLGTFFDAVAFDSNLIDDVSVQLFGETGVVHGVQRDDQARPGDAAAAVA